MFDIGFWELAILALVTLLVVGPERLPRVARTMGLWLGRGRRLLGNLKEEIDREIKADEIKRSFDEQVRSNPLSEAIEDTTDVLRDVRQDVQRVEPESGPQSEGEKPSSDKDHDAS